MTGDYAIKILEWIFVHLHDIEDKSEFTELERQIYEKLLPEFPEFTSMKERAKLRPANFESLTPSQRWEIDKKLGILDWDGD